MDLFEEVPPPRPGARPVTVTSPERAKQILELPAGFIRAPALRRGETATIRLDRRSP